MPKPRRVSPSRPPSQARDDPEAVPSLRGRDASGWEASRDEAWQRVEAYVDWLERQCREQGVVIYGPAVARKLARLRPAERAEEA